MRKMNRESGHMVREMLISMAGFFACLFLAMTLCGCTAAQKVEAKNAAIASSVSVAMVAGAAAAMLLAQCPPSDGKCKQAITALAAISTTSAGVLPAIMAHDALVREPAPPCVPAQEGRALRPGELLCVPLKPVPVPIPAAP